MPFNPKKEITPPKKQVIEKHQYYFGWNAKKRLDFITHLSKDKLITIKK